MIESLKNYFIATPEIYNISFLNFNIYNNLRDLQEEYLSEMLLHFSSLHTRVPRSRHDYKRS